MYYPWSVFSDQVMFRYAVNARCVAFFYRRFIYALAPRDSAFWALKRGPRALDPPGTPVNTFPNIARVKLVQPIAMSSTAPTDGNIPPSQVQTHDGSPSPPPPAPVALTPGPRASRLQQVFNQALLHTVRANSYSNFSSCFPTPAKHVPHSLESVWRQLNAKLEESARAEFDDVIRERQVVRGLNELDRLVGEAKRRRDRGEGENSVAYVSFASKLG